MSSWRRHRDVLAVARGLGFRGRGDAAGFVVTSCIQQVERWIKEFEVTNLADLLDLVKSKVHLLVHEVNDDDELDDLCRGYVKNGELHFARVKEELDDETFALVVRLKKHRRGCTHAAVIDCRGPKGPRRLFSIWHEIAHLLVKPQAQFEFRKYVEDKKDPTEQLMDEIAGELAFYRPMFEVKFTDASLLSFSALESHRLATSPEASRLSAYGSLLRSQTVPAVLLVANLELKAAEKRAASQPSLFPLAEPEKKLRAVTVVMSAAAAEAGLRIPRNYRIPQSSLISRVFLDDTLGYGSEFDSERLSTWTDSRGGRLADVDVLVEARRFGEVVYALITPAA